MKTISLVSVFTMVLFIASCDFGGEKEQLKMDNQQISSVYGEESAENLFDVLESITFSAIEYAAGNSGGRKEIWSDPEIACAEIMFEGNLEGGTILLDFGSGCTGPDNRVRKGKVEVKYEGSWLMAGTKIWTKPIGFYIDDLKIEGVRLVELVSFNAGELVYDVEVTNGKITWPDNTFITRASTRRHTLSFNNTMDEYTLSVEGTASGTTRLNVSYTVQTVEPLVFKSSCRINTIYMPVSGVKTIQVPERPEITVEYGNGACDNTLTVKINKRSAVIRING